MGVSGVRLGAWGLRVWVVGGISRTRDFRMAIEECNEGLALEN